MTTKQATRLAGKMQDILPRKNFAFASINGDDEDCFILKFYLTKEDMPECDCEEDI